MYFEQRENNTKITLSSVQNIKLIEQDNTNTNPFLIYLLTQQRQIRTENFMHPNSQQLVLMFFKLDNARGKST